MKLLSPKHQEERECLHDHPSTGVTNVQLHQSECRIEAMLMAAVLIIENSIKQTKEEIMATQAELVTQLQAVLAQQKKTSGEIATVQLSVDALKQKIVDLEAVIAAGGDASPELTQAVADVKAQAQVVDDQIPDQT